MREHMRSLRFRLEVIIAITFGVMLAALTVTSLYATGVVLNNAAGDNAQLLNISMTRVDEALGMVENYWIGQMDSSDMIILMSTTYREQYYLGRGEDKDKAKEKAEIDYYTAMSRVSKDISTAVVSFNYVDAFFVYASEKNTYLDAAKADILSRERVFVKNKITEILSDEETAQELMGGWRWIEADGEYYILRVYRMSNVYMGAWMYVPRLLQAVKEDGYVEMDYLSLYENSGAQLGTKLSFLEEPVEILSKPTQQRVKSEGERYLLLTEPSGRGDFSMVAMLHESSILEGLVYLKDMIIGCCIFLIIFVIVISLVDRRWILKPVLEICENLRRVGEGEWDEQLYNENYCSEFQLITGTFDQMVDNIKNLKLDIYEGKIARQRARLQYLKLQVNPHFYINCLNVINNMSIMNRNDLVQKMTQYLGNHLRYTLEGNTVDVLRKEIDYIRNYVHIQELRFPDSLTVYIEVEPSVMGVCVPPLTIQTFVENTVKYQVVGGEHTQLYIVVSWCETREDHRIRIEIWDTGEGFSEEILQKLQNHNKIVDEKGEHFGIQNVCERLNLIYHGEEKVTFENHWETGGAYIVMELPDQPAAFGNVSRG